MSVNLDYLDPALLPLEEKVEAYLSAKEDLQKAIVAAHSREGQPVPEDFEQRSATGSFDQQADEVGNAVENLQADLAILRREIMEMLPVRDEWVKVNLGYGPSRVGAFRNEKNPLPEGEDEYILRVVQ
ncbi:hypothetical protein PK28_08515 [Hymenobacter sp. DG25B]|uniref:hypothetical protein n=1 Tax=Hymenobacter sp. DG25B TaxID=1385664 RepID=UPI0005408FE4|nr:hypothetical protein [Hymenobacter sp. DG25B]AIZ63726.1 hypothetical protein PK28_08515 [Hymenobacter sp. DG25B]